MKLLRFVLPLAFVCGGFLFSQTIEEKKRSLGSHESAQDQPTATSLLQCQSDLEKIYMKAHD